MRTLALASTMLMLSACQKDVPRSQMPHLTDFCVHQLKWPELLKVMSEVAAHHDMELHGGIEKDPDGKPLFNAYIARGYSYWFGDDLDLWIVSNPFEAGDMAFNGISKKPWKQSDTQIAREIVIRSAHLSCENKVSQIPR